MTPPRRSRANPKHDRDDEPVLPDVPPDEGETRWGDEPARRDDEWYRRERPPHHE